MRVSEQGMRSKYPKLICLRQKSRSISSKLDNCDSVHIRLNLHTPSALNAGAKLKDVPLLVQRLVWAKTDMEERGAPRNEESRAIQLNFDSIHLGLNLGDFRLDFSLDVLTRNQWQF